MSVYLSKEQELYRSVMQALLNSPIYEITGGRIFDKQPTDINFDSVGNTVPEITYVVIGESRTAPKYSSNQHVEDIVLTMHLYHRNNNNKAVAVDETRGFLSLLSFYAQKVEIADRYRLDKVRLEMQQVITDLDGETLHGIRHTTINEDTYDLNNYCVHTYLEDGVNYIDVYKKFERTPVNRYIFDSMITSKSEEVIEALNRYYNK